MNDPAGKQEVRVPGAWHSGAPYTPAVRVGELVFVSGQVPIDRASGATVGTDIETQTEQVIDNIEALLSEVGLTLGHVVKTTVFLTDGALATGMNRVYADRFPTVRPARSTVQVGPLARPEFLIEVEAVAVDPSR